MDRKPLLLMIGGQAGAAFRKDEETGLDPMPWPVQRLVSFVRRDAGTKLSEVKGEATDCV